jgi:hypothetical protein
MQDFAAKRRVFLLQREDLAYRSREVALSTSGILLAALVESVARLDFGSPTVFAAPGWSRLSPEQPKTIRNIACSTVSLAALPVSSTLES